MCVCVFSLFLSHTGTPESNERPAKKERKKARKKERIGAPWLEAVARWRVSGNSVKKKEKTR